MLLRALCNKKHDVMSGNVPRYAVWMLVLIWPFLLTGCSSQSENRPLNPGCGTILFLDQGDTERVFYQQTGVQNFESSIWNVTEEVYKRSETEGTAVFVRTFYTSHSRNYLTEMRSYQTQSDTVDQYVMTYSIDNGISYYSFINIDTKFAHPEGTLRRYWQTEIVDPSNDTLIVFFTRGVLPDDDPLDGMAHWTVWYGLSNDGGKEFFTEEPIIQKGDQFDEEHPVEGVVVGRNGMMIGDRTSVPIILSNQRRRADNGKILVPVQINPVDEDGLLYNPGGGYTYHYSAVLIGTWVDEETIEWDISEPIKGNPNATTRGLFEPTIVEMPNGELLMVMRGSNGGREDPDHMIKSFKWYSRSEDGGRTWSEPMPWMVDDNTVFYSPSSCSQLLSHSNGRIYWIGNISNQNCYGNLPRWPLVVGEVDPSSMMLIKNSIRLIAIKSPHQDARVTYSNFYAREDRVSKDILVYVTPLFERGYEGREEDWTADAYVYTVNIK